jgi:hypothetical protein
MVPAATNRNIKTNVYFIFAITTLLETPVQRSPPEMRHSWSFLAAPPAVPRAARSAVAGYFIDDTGVSCDLWLDLV